MSARWTLYLCVHNVCFQALGNKILDNISFEVKEGELMAVIGPVGAGKVRDDNIFVLNYREITFYLFNILFYSKRFHVEDWFYSRFVIRL